MDLLNATAGLPDYVLKKLNASYIPSGRAVLLHLPPTVADNVLLYTGLALHALCLGAIVYSFADWKYAPLKAKQIPVVAVTWISSCVFFYPWVF
jgi:hypothetical protein